MLPETTGISPQTWVAVSAITLSVTPPTGGSGWVYNRNFASVFGEGKSIQVSPGVHVEVPVECGDEFPHVVNRGIEMGIDTFWKADLLCHHGTSPGEGVSLRHCDLDHCVCFGGFSENLIVPSWLNVAR